MITDQEWLEKSRRVIGDCTLYNDDWDSDQWDGIWEARTARDGDGWTRLYHHGRAGHG